MEIQEGQWSESQIKQWLNDNPHEELIIEGSRFHQYYPALPRIDYETVTDTVYTQKR
jgi:hypothetical protein